MKFNNKEYEKPTLDSVMQIALASVVMGFALITAFPAVQALIV